MYYPDKELYELGEYCLQIKKHFFYNVPHNCNCLFDDFGLDIEFKIDSPNGKRKLYIKQVRLYQLRLCNRNPFLSSE